MTGTPSKKIKRVRTLRHYVLEVWWSDEVGGEVNLRGLVRRSAFLRPLENPSEFATAAVASWGNAIRWKGGCDISSDTIRRIWAEQRPFRSEEFAAWQSRLELSNHEAADALGISLTTLKAYRSGGNIPYALAVACRAMESDPAVLAAHYTPRTTGRPRGDSQQHTTYIRTEEKYLEPSWLLVGNLRTIFVPSSRGNSQIDALPTPQETTTSKSNSMNTLPIHPVMQ